MPRKPNLGATPNRQRALPSAVDQVYVLCHAEDLWLAQICVSSLRYWYPALPVTLVKDLTAGDFSTRRLEQSWQIASMVLPAARCGPGFAKIELLLRPERERFLVLDADTIVCGPVLRKLNQWSADFVVPRRAVKDPGSAWFTRTYFNALRVARSDPAFIFPGYAFNTGVFVGTSGILTRKLFDPYLEWGSPVRLKSPRTFACADQGLLNYLLVKCAAEGMLTLDGGAFMLWGFAKEFLRLDLERIVSGKGYEAVIHYAGPKPPSIIEYPAAAILMHYDRLYHARLNSRPGSGPTSASGG